MEWLLKQQDIQLQGQEDNVVELVPDGMTLTPFAIGFIMGTALLALCVQGVIIMYCIRRWRKHQSLHDFESCEEDEDDANF